jgi:transcriptional regulator with PAS, ATPase and Fis domain
MTELNRAIDKTKFLTDITVLVAGKRVEREYSKLFIPSLRKHGEYIAVNCGAIPEGID